MSITEWPRAILHLDMDAFYVNVHVLDYPADAGVPLVIGGRPEQRGVVASASYEARKLGVRSAMPTSHALRLCPQLKIVAANWPRIRECSRQVMDVLRPFGPLEQMSVDEAYVDLSGQGEPEALAAHIRQAVKMATGLPASVGLATSKLVAKVASDFDKPEGLTVVQPGAEATFLAPLPARVIWGIGPRTAEKLTQLDIHTCGQLAVADLGTLQAVFGRQAADLQQRAQGVDGRSVHAERGQVKSISQERTFNTDVNDAVFLREQLRKMCSRVAQELQRKNLLAYTVFVKFRWADFTTFTRQRSVTVGLDDADEIYRLAAAIWQENWPPERRMRLLGVGVSKLEETAVRQLGFDFGSQ
ncbi:MAG: DNA polymerase IV [Ardenticatenaceae bacterium]|nr:DNA polymerase IV [Ardenticatenaceae bacterium]MCB8990349.1 DNA polymerase IV [Ardenticatenaceae bacterium]MCB9005242.1 DNA polymerase IV [Ardenticatenaceae bacterium]